MGITISYCGHLKTPGDYLTVTGIGREFARRKGLVVYEMDVSQKELTRVKNGEICIYNSSVRGIAFQPHPKSEFVTLQFDSDNYLCEFCKTQYAGIATHLEVLDFLREIEPYFKDFQVNDEGDFWNTGDIGVLEEKFAFSTAILGKLGNLLSDDEDPDNNDGESSSEENT